MMDQASALRHHPFELSFIPFPRAFSFFIIFIGNKFFAFLL